MTSPETISHYIRVLFVISSLAGLGGLYWIFRRYPSRWRVMVGSTIYFIEIGIFYILRLADIPSEAIYANWISSILHLSGMLLVIILTSELVKALK